MVPRLTSLILACAVFATACSDEEPPSAAPTSAATGDASATSTPTQSAAAPATAATQPSPTVPATPQPEPTATPSPALLPIIDMHFHPDEGWDIDQLVALMDELGVERAVGGSGNSGVDALRFAAAYPGRFLPFAGQDGMRALNLIQGAPSWQLQSEESQAYADKLEAQLQAGCWEGIGEAFINTRGSHVSGGFNVPADSALMRRLLDLAAEYDAPLSVHMDAAPASVAELQRLLDSNRDGVFLWAHAGWYATPAQLRELLQAHPNLYVELSFRDELRSFYPVTTGGGLQDDWRDLLEEMPDRFVLGTDLLPPPTPEKYSELVRFWRGVLDQLTPETAALIAHGNAEQLLDETRPTDPEACAAMLEE